MKRRSFLTRFTLAIFLVSVFAMVLPSAPARAKTVEEWLEGYDLGNVWFGEDFAYDITDEAACWELLMQPITVLDAEQNEKIAPLDEPNGKKVNTDKLGGTINGASAAVHVLGENEGGWTLIEGLDYYNRVIRGYVKTRLLKTVTPRNDYGIIIDKLTQTMYVFKNGKLWSSCLVSTGLPNDDQPYNETAAGEYLICSRVGDFNSEGMICATAMRFNGGDMIHQVPYVERADGSADFARWEALLGSKASHGCVRTQRVKTTEGLNARWLWDNIKLNTKVVIWDDIGRKRAYPDEDAKVYYNPKGGTSYHSDQNCDSVKKQYLPLTEITYADLETSQYSGLTRCTKCCPEKRISEIAQENYERGTITQEELRQVLRPIPYPDDSTVLYYNPNGGKYYHSVEDCYSVKSQFLPLKPFTYGQLAESSFKKLKPCPYCSPVKTRAEIDRENTDRGYDLDEVQSILAGETTIEPETDSGATITVEDVSDDATDTDNADDGAASGVEIVIIE